jgi:hypothetical protein
LVDNYLKLIYRLKIGQKNHFIGNKQILNDSMITHKPCEGLQNIPTNQEYESVSVDDNNLILIEELNYGQKKGMAKSYFL